MSRVDLPGEEWRPVPGYEGLYEVSNLGRVYSVRSDRVMRHSPNAGGYPAVDLWRDEVRKRTTVHLLVAAAFIGPRPEGQQVRHLDGDPKNSRVGNLCYGTPSENAFDRVRHGTHPWANKTHCPQGHPYDEANTRVWKRRRNCRACHKARTSGKAA